MPLGFGQVNFVSKQLANITDFGIAQSVIADLAF